MSKKRKAENNTYDFLITEVRNPNTGLIEQASYLLGQSEEIIHNLRYNIDEGKECPFCKSRLIIKYSKNKKNPFFSHTRISDDRKCHLIDGNLPPENKIIQQYNYGKESQEHIDLKEFTRKYLSLDPLTKNLLVEQVKKGEATPYEWKKPDVSCTYDSTPIVFEVQISNTWLSDIVARDKFYKANSTQILWIFNEFDPKHPDFKITYRDIFYNNPEINLFVLDEAAKKLSEKMGKLYFTCWYKNPSVNYKALVIEHRWKNSLVSLSELNFDSIECKPYFKPIMDLRRDLKEEIEKIKKSNKARIESDRQAWIKGDEAENNPKIKKDPPNIYLRFQKYIMSDIIDGYIIADNGKKMSAKELTEYSVQFLEKSYKKPEINEEDLEKFGRAIYSLFGGSGSKLFVRISEFCPGQDYWTAITIYKKYEENANNLTYIRDFLKFCFDTKTHNNDTLDVLILGLKKMENLEEE